MKYYYHLTSFESAKSIFKYGFKRGKKGMLGPGIYFAEKSKDTLVKACSKVKDAMFIVVLNVGHVITVDDEHHDWNHEIVKKKGYDSVQKLNCKSGPEICIYEPRRIKIIGLIHWDKFNIEFMITKGNSIDISEFDYLTHGRKVYKLYINLSDKIKCHFNSNHSILHLHSKCVNGLSHDFLCRDFCKNCGKPKCKCGYSHDFLCRDFCKYCGKPKCKCGYSHDFLCRDFCKYCNKPKCQCGYSHDFLCRDFCKYCGKPKCKCGYSHDFLCRDFCKYCGKPKCKCGYSHDFLCRDFCKYCGKPKCQCGYSHDFLCRDFCKYCGKPKS